MLRAGSVAREWFRTRRPAPHDSVRDESGLTSATYRHRRVLLALTVLLMAGSAALVPSLHSSLNSGWTDFDDSQASNVAARQVIQRATGVDAQQGYILVVHFDKAVEVADPSPLRLEAARRILRSRPEVKSVADYRSPGMTGLLSSDRRSAVLFAQVGPVTEKEVVPQLEEQLESDPLLAGHVDVGGPTPGGMQVTQIVLSDLTKAELIVFPALFILLVVVFRGIAAALVPLIGSGVTVLFAMIAMRGIVEIGSVSVYSLNLILALGLGLSIDFSLLVTSRYREELAESGSGLEALRSTMRTAGRTVLFSGLTVASAMVALLVFPQRVVFSMGIAGILASAAALIYALIVLPAVLATLGTRIEWGAPRRWQRHSTVGAMPDPSALRWRRVATHVMNRPAIYATVASVALLILASPLLGVKFTGAQSPTVLPQTVSSGLVAAQLRAEFPQALTDQEQLVIDGARAAQPQVLDYLRDVQAIDGVAVVGQPEQIDSQHWLAPIMLDGEPISARNQSTLRSIDRIDSLLEVRVAGSTADVLALNKSLGAHLPVGIAVLISTTLVMLFAMTASVVLPVKAILMNALSLGASLGIIVLIFQYGHLAGPFGVTTTGAIESTSPIYLGAVAFGLSTDYGIFLLGRIKEARDNGASDKDAIAEGIEKTGRIVTSAAGLFCLAMCALLISRLDFIKELGLGAALAVVIDATIVRAILVPSLMTLLGAKNWWAPKSMRRLHRKLGLDRIHSAQDPILGGRDGEVGSTERLPQPTT